MNIVDITEDQLAKDWTLAEQDIQFIISSTRGEPIQIRTAIWLCILRKTGSFLIKRSDISLKAVNYLAYQLNLTPLLRIPDFNVSKADYARFIKIQNYLCYKEFDEVEKQLLAYWLTEQTKDISDKKELTRKATEYLKQRRVILPNPNAFNRFIASSIKNAYLDLYKYIVSCFSIEHLCDLDKFIAPIENSLYTELIKFKRPPPEPNAKIINQFLTYFETLEKIKITECDLSAINPKIIESLASLAKNYSSWSLRRIKPDEKRYAILICFLSNCAKTILDTVIDMHSLILGDIERKSKNEFKVQRVAMIGQAKSSRKKTLDFVKQALAHEAPEQIMLADFLVMFNIHTLQEAVDKVEGYEQFEEQGIITNIIKRFSYVRKYSKTILKLNFEAASGTKSLLEAIKILRAYHESNGKIFPNNPPISFISKPWRVNLRDSVGNFQIKYWEMGVYYAMRQSLNKGDLYLTDSRHHRYFWDTIYKPMDWQIKREEAYHTLALPTLFDKVALKLKGEFECTVELVRENLGKEGFATIVNNNIKLCKDDSLEIPIEA